MGIKKVIKKIIRPTVVYNTVVQNPTAGNLLQGKVAIVTVADWDWRYVRHFWLKVRRLL